VTLRFTGDNILSDQTEHSAVCCATEGQPDNFTWRATWLPDRELTLGQATTAMILAEHVDQNGLWDYSRSAHIDGWAAELGLSGPDAIGMLTPEMEAEL
jgi:hypothetical protein